MMQRTNVLMCGSSLAEIGGIATVAKNYLGYDAWDEFRIIYVPTHAGKNKCDVAMRFAYAYCRIFCMAVTGKVQIAHLHTAERGSFFRKALLGRMLRRLGVKVVMHHHEAEFDAFYEKLPGAFKKYVCKTMELVHLNIVLGERSIPMVRQRAPHAKIEVLNNTVRTYSTNKYNGNANTVLFLGRLGTRKGAYDLLEAIRLSDVQMDPEIRFRLCGDGEIAQVNEKIDALKIRHRISAVGPITDMEKESVFRETIINVLPSYNEGLPFSILECMAWGIPCISTNIAAIPEVLHHNENGILITPGDIPALQQAILRLLQDKALCELFSQKSYALICKDFALSANLERLKGMYRKLVS